MKAAITKVLDKLAEIYNTTPEKVAEITTLNSKNVFGI